MVDAQIESKAKILIVEDDTEISRLTSMLFESEGYACHSVDRGDIAIEEVKTYNPDLIILDIMLPGLSGIEVCGKVREFYAGAIIMLTGCNDDISELSSFKKGADDYVIKPIKPHLLLARIDALLKRTKGSNQITPVGTIINGDMLIDLAKRELTVRGQNIDLSSAEFDVLELLAKHMGEVIEREKLYEELRGFSYDAGDRSIDMRISVLRKKLAAVDPDKKRILTIRNRGYMLVAEGGDQ